MAGAACNKIAEMVINGEEVGEGTDLGIDGYNSLKAQGNVLYGDAAVYVDAETGGLSVLSCSEYHCMG
ncbi:MAG: hypothetical protein R3A10_19015 [Caldilineaceae bacterium]